MTVLENYIGHPVLREWKDGLESSLHGLIGTIKRE